MISFDYVGQIEKQYAYIDAVVEAPVMNGTFGKITSGVFAPAAAGTCVVAQLEVGDMVDDCMIPEGHVRVLDLAKINGQTVVVYGDVLPATYTVGAKLGSKADGTLGTTSTAPYLQVTEVLNGGVVAKVVATTA